MKLNRGKSLMSQHLAKHDALSLILHKLKHNRLTFAGRIGATSSPAAWEGEPPPPVLLAPTLIGAHANGLVNKLPWR